MAITLKRKYRHNQHVDFPHYFGQKVSKETLINPAKGDNNSKIILKDRFYKFKQTVKLAHRSMNVKCFLLITHNYDINMISNGKQKA